MNIVKRHAYEQKEKTHEMTVFIDVFRASTSLLYLFQRNVEEIILPLNDDRIPTLLNQGYVLVSEVLSDGLDNSPTQILNTNLHGKKVILRTGNLSTAILNNPPCHHAVVAGFANIGIVGQHIRTVSPCSVELLMASHYTEKRAALEDESCAELLECILQGESCKGIPYLMDIEAEIESRKSRSLNYPAHYWEDLTLALQVDSVPMIPKIIKRVDDVFQFVGVPNLIRDS